MRYPAPGIDQILSYISERGSPVRFRKGQVVFPQGTNCDRVFCLTQGAVKLSVSSEQGKEAIIGVIGQNELFGEDALIDGGLRAYSAQCLTDVQAVKIDPRLLWEYLKGRHDQSHPFIAFLLRRNRALEEHLAKSLSCTGAQRLEHILSSIANGERLGRLPKISQETLAEMIGTTRQYVNFLLKSFRASNSCQQDTSQFKKHINKEIGYGRDRRLRKRKG